MQSKSDSNVNQKCGMIKVKLPVDFCKPFASPSLVSDMRGTYCCWRDKESIRVIHHLVHIIIVSFFPSPAPDR